MKTVRFAPKGIPHRFEAGIDGGEMIVTASPAKFDSFVKELGLQVPKDSGLPDFKVQLQSRCNN